MFCCHKEFSCVGDTALHFEVYLFNVDLFQYIFLTQILNTKYVISPRIYILAFYEYHYILAVFDVQEDGIT